ncbi:MAG: phosphoglucomutase/phosphomannomutase family protein [Clostridia bacterium]|nr:phosphoglucomutase/phosphomannomutase family protein [Clostridia bacterium]
MIKFGTGGFRGVIGDDFNKENVSLVAQALSEIILKSGSKKSVVVGYDYRFGSDYFAGWIAETLAGNKVSCLLYTEPMPSPAIMTAVRDEGLDYGVMITASHNPYYFNGVKIFVKGGCDADVEFTNLLERAVMGVKEIKNVPLACAKSAGLVQNYSNKEQYLDNILKFVSPSVKYDKINILYDNLCGVGAKCIEPLFKKAGVKNYTILHPEHDAFFCFMMPNPTEQAMSPLKQSVKVQKYDFAMATDSDSDRLGIIDEKGNYVTSNDILACLYYYLVKHRGMKGDVVKNCATSILVDKVAERLGYNCHEVDVGFKNISAAIRQYDALIGGESSGGLTVRGYIYGKDSVFSSLLFTEMVVAMNKPVSEIVEEVHRFAGYNYVFIEDEIRFEKEDGLIEFLEANSPQFDRKLLRCDHFNRNFKYYFENGCWAIIRLSGTEPVFRVFAECESEEGAKRIVEQLRKLINSYTESVVEEVV